MNKKFFIVLFFAAALIMSAKAVIIQKGDNAKPTEVKEKLSTDYFFGGKTLNFSGDAPNLFFGGKSLNFKGNLKHDLHAVGTNLSINGSVENGIKAAGKKVELNGQANGTTFVAGNLIRFEKTSINNGTVFVAGKDVKLSGKINGDVYAAAAELTIDGEITGNVKTTSGKIHLTDAAKITGKFTYKSEKELSQNEKAKISGSVEYSKIKEAPFNCNINDRKKFIAFFLFLKIALLIGLLAAGLLLLLLPFTKHLEKDNGGKTMKYALWGLIPFLIYPGIIILSFALVVTIPLALVLLLAGIPILFITTILGITLFGKFLFGAFKWKSTSRFLFFLFGILIFALLRFIPFVGFIAGIFFSSLGWGIILEKIFDKKLV
jgi:hypothetical protein